jgi:hypothetical protein
MFEIKSGSGGVFSDQIQFNEYSYGVIVNTLTKSVGLDLEPVFCVTKEYMIDFIRQLKFDENFLSLIYEFDGYTITCDEIVFTGIFVKHIFYFKNGDIVGSYENPFHVTYTSPPLSGADIILMHFNSLDRIISDAPVSIAYKNHKFSGVCVNCYLNYDENKIYRIVKEHNLCSVYDVDGSIFFPKNMTNKNPSTYKIFYDVVLPLTLAEYEYDFYFDKYAGLIHQFESKFIMDLD